MSKAYEKLTIANPFMFGKVAQDPENIRIILESLLMEDIVISKLPQREKYYKTRSERIAKANEVLSESYRCRYIR